MMGATCILPSTEVKLLRWFCEPSVPEVPPKSNRNSLSAGNKLSKGRAIQNLLNIEQDDKIKAYVKVQDLNGDGKLDIFAADRRLNLIWQKDVDGVYKRKPL